MSDAPRWLVFVTYACAAATLYGFIRIFYETGFGAVQLVVVIMAWACWSNNTGWRKYCSIPAFLLCSWAVYHL